MDGSSIVDWQPVITGDAAMVRIGPSCGDGANPSIVFPGAFNPLHAGHKEMAAWAQRYLNGPVEFEISITNVDKPVLTSLEIRQRLAQFSSLQSVWLTRAPTFLEKSVIFPQAIFVVGLDTIARIGNPTYYDGDGSRRDAAIEAISARHCRFLVFGRLLQARFQALRHVELPDSLLEICQEVTEDDFRQDISSSELRRQRE